MNKLRISIMLLISMIIILPAISGLHVGKGDLYKGVLDVSSATGIGVVPSTETVFVGNEFNLTIYIDPTEEIGGWSLDLSFIQGMVNVLGVMPWDEWNNIVENVSLFDPGDIDNENGTITNIQTWTTGLYPSVNHTACIVSFTAVYPGICDIELVNVQITDSEFQDVDFIRYNTTITIENNGDDNANDEIWETLTEEVVLNTPDEKNESSLKVWRPER